MDPTKDNSKVNNKRGIVMFYASTKGHLSVCKYLLESGGDYVVASNKDLRDELSVKNADVLSARVAILGRR